MGSKQQQTGMRGVYLAAAELAGRGFLVSPTSRSAYGADLLITDASCNQAFSVQVKTNARTFAFWLLNAKAKDLVSRSHFYILINLRKSGPEYFIVPSRAVARRMKVEKSKTGSVFYSFPNDRHTEKYKDNWSLFQPD